MATLRIVLDQEKERFSEDDVLRGRVILRFPRLWRPPCITKVTITLDGKVVVKPHDEDHPYGYNILKVTQTLFSDLSGLDINNRPATAQLTFMLSFPDLLPIPRDQTPPPVARPESSPRAHPEPPSFIYTSTGDQGKFSCSIDYGLHATAIPHSDPSFRQWDPFSARRKLEFFPLHHTPDVDLMYQQILIPSTLDIPPVRKRILSFLRKPEAPSTAQPADFEVALQAPTVLRTFTNPVFWLWVNYPAHISFMKLHNITISVEESTTAKFDGREMSGSSTHVLCSFSDIDIPPPEGHPLQQHRYEPPPLPEEGQAEEEGSYSSNFDYLLSSSYSPRQPSKHTTLRSFDCQPLPLESFENPQKSMAYYPSFQSYNVARSYKLKFSIVLSSPAAEVGGEPIYYCFRNDDFPVTIISHQHPIGGKKPSFGPVGSGRRIGRWDPGRQAESMIDPSGWQNYSTVPEADAGPLQTGIPIECREDDPPPKYTP